MTGILCSLTIIGAPTASPPTNPLAVSLNRSTVSGSSTSANITTNTVTATGSGGDGGYSYVWSRVSGDSSITATTGTSSRTSFTRTGCVAGTSYSAVWRCRVTDASANVIYSSNVSITITCTSGGGGGGSGGGTFNGLSDQVVEANGAGTQTASFSINSDGTYTGGSWNSSSTVGSGYEVKATVTSGHVSNETTLTWLALSSNRTWLVADSVSDSASVDATFTLQIRATGTTTVLDSATIDLSANRTS